MSTIRHQLLVIAWELVRHCLQDGREIQMGAGLASNEQVNEVSDERLGVGGVALVDNVDAGSLPRVLVVGEASTKSALAVEPLKQVSFASQEHYF